MSRRRCGPAEAGHYDRVQVGSAASPGPLRLSSHRARPADRDEMLAHVGVSSLDALMDEAIPPSIRLDGSARVCRRARPSTSTSTRSAPVAAKNRVCKSYIGMGYYDCVTPAVILRNVLENPGWYTPYTPYQAEIAQGRLESLLNFQTMVCDLTGMEIATASLLDEATAAAEAMTMLHRVQSAPPGSARNVFLASRKTFPQTLDVSADAPSHWESSARDRSAHRTRSTARSSARSCSIRTMRARSSTFGRSSRRLTPAGARIAVASDLLALTLLTPPGEMDADVVVGNSQRFGVPMGYGGPHAAFFATREAFVRQAPGRIIGVSIDAHGQPRVPHDAPDARAAHPAGKGDVEHLHRAGAARQHRRDVRRVPRTGGADRPSPGGCTASRAGSRETLDGLGMNQTNAQVSSTRSACGAEGGPLADRVRPRRASTPV